MRIMRDDKDIICLPRNICRSPMAEIFMKDDCLKHGVAGHYYIDSAAVSTEEIYHGVGNPVYPQQRLNYDGMGFLVKASEHAG